jgi:hypothetical protein
MADSTLAKIQGQGGILKTSTEEVSNLAGKAGLQAAPTDAMNTGALGGNADQQKMAGTPNQVANALKLSLRPSETLAQAERVESGRTTAMGEAGRELPESLKQLAGLGGKIGAAIGQAVAGAGPKVELNQTAISALPVDKQEPVKAAASAFHAVMNNPASTSAQKIAALNTLTALIPDGATGVAKLFGTDHATWVKSIQENPAFNDVTLKDLNAVGGTVDTGSILAVLREMDPSLTMEGLEKLGWGEVKNRVNNYLGSRYMDVDNLTRQAQDLTLPSNVRNEAVKRLRQLGVAGVTQAAEQAKSLSDAIEQGDNITFNGQEMELDEVLNDEFIGKTLKGVLENPEMLNNLKGTPFEGLIDQISKYSTELAAKYGVDPTKASELTTLIATKKANIEGVNKAVTDLGFDGDISGLSSDVMTALGLTKGMADGTEAFDPMKNTSTLYKTLMGLPVEMRGEMAGKIKGMTAAQIKDFESALIGRGRGFTNADEMKNFITSYDNASKLFGGILSDFNKDGKTDNADMYAALSATLGVDLTGYDGDDTGVPLPDWLDSNPKDGKADDATVVQKKLEGMSVLDRMNAISGLLSNKVNIEHAISQNRNEMEQFTAVNSPIPGLAAIPDIPKMVFNIDSPSSLWGRVAEQRAVFLQSIDNKIQALDAFIAKTFSPQAKTAAIQARQQLLIKKNSFTNIIKTMQEFSARATEKEKLLSNSRGMSEAMDGFLRENKRLYDRLLQQAMDKAPRKKGRITDAGARAAKQAVQAEMRNRMLNLLVADRYALDRWITKKTIKSMWGREQIAATGRRAGGEIDAY